MADSPPPIPIILLKTRSTPTDPYWDLLSSPPSSPNISSPNFHPIFVPPLTYTLHSPAISHLATLFSSPQTLLAKHSGLILTSPRAVEALQEVFNLLSSPPPPSTPSETPTARSRWHAFYPPSSSSLSPSTSPSISPPPLKIFVVGPATANATTSLLTNANIFPAGSWAVEGAHTGNGEALANYILDTYNSSTRAGVSGNLAEGGEEGRGKGKVERKGERKTLLFLVGEKRRDVIPRMLRGSEVDGVGVEEIVVYETKERREFGGELEDVVRATATAIRTETGMGTTGTGEMEMERERWVVVFSPQGVETVMRVLGWMEEGGERVRGGTETKEGREEEWRRRRESGDGVGEPLTRVMAIGPTTRGFLLERFGFEVDAVADRPSAEGVLEAISRVGRGVG